MKLLSSSASPFGRKVKITAKILNIPLEVELVDTVSLAADRRHPNPLGKIPVLIIAGKPLYDSTAICLRLAKESKNEQFAAIDNTDLWNLHGVATGLTEAALLIVYEGRMRDIAHRSPIWLDHQQQKIDRALAWLSEQWLPQTHNRLDSVALASALGYLDLRFEGRWRARHPKLVSWLNTFARQTPAFEQTKPE